MESSRSILATAAATLLGLVLSPSAGRGAEPWLRVSVESGGTPFRGDGPTLVTVSPNGDGYRDAVLVHYRVRRDSFVRFQIARHGAATRALARSRQVAVGDHVLRWAPPSRPLPASYLLRVSVGGSTATVVVHVQGLDAAASRSTYRAGESARIALSTDARALLVDVLGITGAAPTTRRNDKVQGTPMAPATEVIWSDRGTSSRALRVAVGPWPSGVYFARLRADDGRIGYAPFVVGPRRQGRSRIAIVVPTNTWQAYNFYDGDGDGYGDTWYAGWRRRTTRLGRPYLNRGVPAHFNIYDLPFLRWAARRELRADYLSDSDLEAIGSGDELARLYDLVVFPGHHEYVTRGEYGIVCRYRDLGGNLAWLSANNFFWKVTRRGSRLERIAQWRRLGLPEAALIGVQYHGNDEGQRREPMVVGDPAATPWLFDGTGLDAGDSFGRFGIEIDARAPSSPPGTIVVASVRELFGPGWDAEMTYYELPNGAKVFAAGAFTLAGLADSKVGAQLLDNIFAHLSDP